jgi:hypothetical protein
MTYGPLWAWITMGLSAVARRHAVLEFFLFKLVLAGSWVLTLSLVRRLAATRSVGQEAVAVSIFGWIPASSELPIAEGHNDIVMVLFLTLWLYLLAARRTLWSPLALSASVLIKYVTMPILALELVHSGRRVWRRPARYLLVLALCLGIAALLYAPFVADGNPFAATAAMADWHFWTPATAIATAALRFGLPIPAGLAGLAIKLACGLAVLYYLIGYLRDPSVDSVIALLLAGLLLILFVVVGHVWPWFLIWSLPLVALRWDCLPSKILIPALFAVPLLDAHWVLSRSWRAVPDFGLAFYAVVAVLSLAAGWFMHRRARVGLDSALS